MTTSSLPEQNLLADAIEQAVTNLSFEEIQQQYWTQNELIVLEGLLSPDLVERVLTPRVESLKSSLNRNFIPGHKKGGSVSYFTVRDKGPEFMALYESPAFLDFLSRLVKSPLLPCPENDPHACALYYYTEPGDHIGFHYDTSYYKGARYTVLMGLIDQSRDCQLVCQLYKDDPSRETQEVRLITKPGDCVIFNGDKLWHAVTPLGDHEYRVVLTMEYVTNQGMSPFKRLYSNLKDAFGYFGLRAFLKTS